MFIYGFDWYLDRLKLITKLSCWVILTWPLYDLDQQFCLICQTFFVYSWIKRVPGQSNTCDITNMLENLDITLIFIWPCPKRSDFFNFVLIFITFHLFIDLNHTWTKQYSWPNWQFGWFLFDLDLSITLTDNVIFFKFWQGEVKEYALCIPFYKETKMSSDSPYVVALVLNLHTVPAGWYKRYKSDLSKLWSDRMTLFCVLLQYIFNIFKWNYSMYFKAILWYGLTV